MSIKLFIETVVPLDYDDLNNLRLDESRKSKIINILTFLCPEDFQVSDVFLGNLTVPLCTLLCHISVSLSMGY